METEGGGSEALAPAIRLSAGASDDEVAAVVAALRVLADEVAARRSSAAPSVASRWARAARLTAVDRHERAMGGGWAHGLSSTVRCFADRW